MLQSEQSFTRIIFVMTTVNDAKHLATLQNYYAEHRVLPSYTRLTSLLGFASKSGIKKVLERLQAAGMLERTTDGDWAPSERFFDRSIAHLPVVAGMPLPTADEGGEALTLDRFLIARPADTVLVRVKGDSMTGAGIHSGDLAVIEKRSHAQPGEVVVAVVDDEFTLKTLARDNAGYHLLPANPDFPVIRPNGKLEIFGVLVGLVRKYP